MRGENYIYGAVRPSQLHAARPLCSLSPAGAGMYYLEKDEPETHSTEKSHNCGFKERETEARALSGNQNTNQSDCKHAYLPQLP